MDRREYLKNVYFDTKGKVKTGHYGRLPRGFSTTYQLDNEINMTPIFESTNIEVINDDVLSVTGHFKNNKTLVLNLASEICPGGGVAKGSMAQEEEIFRRTNYCFFLPRSLYPILPTNVIVTTNVTIVKDENYEDLERPFTVSFIAAAAVRKPVLNRGKYNKQDYETMCQTIDNIFRTAYALGYDTLILGALGCGAFKNPPEIVANIFRNYSILYDGCFKNIIFSVMSRNDDNHLIFSSTLGSF